MNPLPIPDPSAPSSAPGGAGVGFADDPVGQRDQLRAEALEQLMRMSADESLVYGFLDSVDVDPAAALVGRTLVALNTSLAPGCPLLAYGAGRALDHAWRRHYPPAERSLYAELLFCRQMAGVAPGDEGVFDDAFAELEHLRDLLDITDLDLA